MSGILLVSVGASFASAAPIGDNSVEFDGAGDYLKSPTSSVFAFDTGDFTMEAWIYPTSLSGTQGVVSTRINGSAATNQIFFGTSGTNLLYYAGLNVSGGPLVADTWQHVACSRQSGTVRIFLNGSQLGSNLTDTNTKTTTFGYVGAGGGDGSQLFIGNVSNARFVKGTAVYTGTFTPPTSNLTNISGTSLLTCQSPSVFADNSSNNFSLTIAGDPTASTNSPY